MEEEVGIRYEERIEEMTYEERMKERTDILQEIHESQIQLENLSKKISELKKQVKDCETEKSELEIIIKNLERKYIQKGIPVPSDGEFEICGGLVGAKRDINLKLIRGLDDEEVRQVLLLLFF
jgi:hypothetical protein